MKIPYHLLFVVLIALASCGSTKNTSEFRRVPIEADTTIIPKVVIPDEEIPVLVKETVYLKDVKPLTISLLLPLNIKSGEYKMADVIADYYEGILLGLDSIKNMGIDVVLNVYDTKSDSATVKKITWKKELAESDVIIGPLFKKGHALLLPYAKARDILLVSPFSNANMWSDSNHYAAYCTPEENSFAAALAETINKKHPKAKLLLFNDNTKADKDFIWRFKVAAKELGMSGWTDITYKSGWNIKPHLLKDDSSENIIIAPTDNNRVALELLTQLSNDEEQYNNILFVRDSWLAFNSISFQTYQLWQKNNLHVLTHYYVDDHEKTAIRFKALYKNKFNTMPDEFAFRGFDHVLAIGNAYSQTTDETPLKAVLTSLTFKGLHNNFKFRFNGKSVENQSVNVTRFVDYRFLRVK